MPIYQFRCQCGNRKELQRSIDHRRLPVTCQACGRDMEFQFSAPGAVLFRGSGFHKNDYPTTAR